MMLNKGYLSVTFRLSVYIKRGQGVRLVSLFEMLDILSRNYREGLIVYLA